MFDMTTTDTSTLVNSPFDLTGLITALAGSSLPGAATFAPPMAVNGTLTTPIVTPYGTFTTPTFAKYDPSQTPSRITGWIDFEFHNYSYDPTTLASVTADIWTDRTNSASKYVVLDGVVMPYVAPAPTRAQAAETALANLSAARYGHETGGFTYAPPDGGPSLMVPTDRETQAKLNAAFVMASNGYWQDGTPWKLADGSFVPMTKATIMAVAVAAAGFVATCFAIEAQKAGLINAASDPASVDLAAGWPG